jgi:transcriptional regulator with XRE-family HTH domain
MSIAGKNLRHLRKLRGWTQDDFAIKLGIKRSLVGAYEEERADPRLDVLEIVMELFSLSMDDLLLKDLSQEGESYLAKRRKLKMATVTRTASIQFVPVKAAAGYLAGYNDPEFVDELNTFALPMLAPGDYRAFEIIGDSMLPTPSGSVVVGEKIENFDALKNDQPCIVVSRMDGIVYKRVNKSARSKQMTLTLVSDNPQYPAYTVKADEIAEIWAAKMVISKPVEKPVWDLDQLANVVNSLQEKVSSLQGKSK